MMQQIAIRAVKNILISFMKIKLLHQILTTFLIVQVKFLEYKKVFILLVLIHSN